MQVAWWLWVSIGIITLLAEATTPGGFYMLFIGLAAIIVGAVEPLIPALWIEIVLFAVLSVAMIVFFRKPLVNRLHKDTPHADTPEFIGETARAIDAIPAGGEGSAELRGTVWKVRNESDVTIDQGAQGIITARDGLKLLIKPKQ